MHYSYTTKGTCSSEIEFDLDGDIVHNVQFVGGRNGNLKAISSLVDGLTITCGFKSTSCSDQLATALLEALDTVQ